jgi:hypothetical protein
VSKVESIASAFESYRQVVMPKDAPDVQIEECRRAFYAGSYALLMNVAHNIGDESTDEEDGIRQLETLKAECEIFAASVGQPLPQPVESEPVEQLAYNVRSDAVESALRELAGQIKSQVPSGWMFTLMIFSGDQTGLPGEGKAGSMFYISTARRDDMVQAMKEFIARNTQ